ncbi:hypothetical protein [Neobacillus drentensis]|uniref:hypothetical protein n=1 Tax=Neobacillus drentensis TaxID=220684 RepID=UPI002FFE8432
MTDDSPKKKKGVGKISLPTPNISKRKEQSPSKFLSEPSKTALKEKLQSNIRFSFNYFDRSHELFNCGRTESQWFIDLFDNLKQISNLNKNEFLFDQKYKNHYDTHQHDWVDKQDKIYPLPQGMFEQVIDDCWQFRLSSSNGRVHGIMIENVFYIVWFDPHHNFYPDEKFGGEKFYKRPWTSYETLQYENEELKKENQGLMELLEQATS